ncbi:DeoR/GlpR family DNA-binding transcription regulator [Paracoccus albus]|uniref:DeoR/GlpR family DNA-binding transcription regulator n=1 Tax=Paracoccus albus TaxID=3017784 RepID=UPI0022EFEBA0|nr:DeoR/GlpR family DNA-binding transcription regulator [Paracoccus albus]WBU60876.1 DeoR/GlpR family DNA-binding transcription regulator [Paracoccus albus]
MWRFLKLCCGYPTCSDSVDPVGPTAENGKSVRKKICASHPRKRNVSDPTEPSNEELLPAERRELMMDWFNIHFSGTTQDLAERFNASVSTIRRDLDLLAKEGFLSRTHGGAVRMRQSATYEPSTDLARRTAVEEKAAIIAEAVTYIQPDQSILIDTGTIMHDLADAISKLDFPLTVITNDICVAHKLTYKPLIKLLVPGGSNRFGAFSLYGEPGISFLENVRCDLLFLTAQAIDSNCASDTVLELVEVKRAMIAASTKTILLADSSRFKSRALYKICDLKQIQRAITDMGLDVEEQERIRSHGVELTSVDL